MKSFLLMISLFVCGIANATTYYVSPTGNDGNAGTINSPWRTIEHNLSAGDIMYVRGGTYLSTKANSASVHFMVQNLTGTAINPIKIWAYPGEQPIFSMSNITPSTYENPIGLYVLNCSYVHIKGIHVTFLRQVPTGGGISHGVTLWNSQHCTMELIEVDNIGGPGMTIESNSNDNLIKNCDSHHNGDGLSSSQWDSSDGFDCSTGGDFSTRNVFDGCRAWLNCDDGYDTFNSNSFTTFKNCWAFWNGVKPWGPTNTQVTPSAMTTNDYNVWHNNASYISSSGEGFKLGPANSQNFTLLTRLVENCVSFENRGTGYASNSLSSLTAKHQLYNNIAYKNDNDGFSYGAGWSVGATQSFKNNWAWGNNVLMSGANFVYDGNNSTGISNNYWDNYYGGVNYGNIKSTIGQVTNADFLSVSSLGADGPRQADGSLPNLNFLKLAPSSRFINKGVDVGIVYNSTAPDVGAYEFGTGVTPVTLLNFSATAKAGKTLLQWATATEINSSHFEIERSTDGVHFEAIGVVNSKGNSNVQVNYQLYDYFPGAGVNYYRLKMVDKDGQYEYSRIVSVNFKNSSTGSFVIATATINNKNLFVDVSSVKQQSATLGLYDAGGKTIFTSNIILQKGVNSINRNVSLAGGVYYLKLTTTDQTLSLPVLNGQ